MSLTWFADLHPSGTYAETPTHLVHCSLGRMQIDLICWPHPQLVLQFDGSSCSGAMGLQELGHDGNWYIRIYIKIQDLSAKEFAGFSIAGVAVVLTRGIRRSHTLCHAPRGPKLLPFGPRNLFYLKFNLLGGSGVHHCAWRPHGTPAGQFTHLKGGCT
jgi:hypothetical protein